MAHPQRMLLLTVSGDVHLKSARTQRRLRRTLRANLDAALDRNAPGARVTRGPQGRLAVVTDDPEQLEAAAGAAARVFGIYRVVQVEQLTAASLPDLVTALSERALPWVEGHTFAVRIRRRGNQDWRSSDAERDIGTALLPASAGVNLGDPEVEVRAEVYDDDVYLVERTWDGADGLPLGTQESALSLLSGGFDSPVAAWMLMRRGCPIDFVHLMMDCSQGDHALAVAYGLWEEWGSGTDPLAWVVDFSEVKESLLTQVASQQRQVVLKQLMFAAADALAAREHHPALVTGEAVGQVSSQTLTNLAEIDRACERTVLRPLAGMTKNEIIARARECGTHDLSARAKEVCDLSDGPVEVAARRRRLERAVAALPEDLVTRALGERKVIRLADWAPGVELAPVTDAPPPGVPVLGPDDEVPHEGPVAFSGRGAAHRASPLAAAGRPVWVVDQPLRRRLRRAG